MKSRWKVYETIKSLDPVRDNQRIVFLTGAFDFPFETQRALELALIRTFAVPRMSALLVQTARFAGNAQHRYDSTALIIAEIAENGYDSERGRAAIRRMNQLHHRFQIENEDYLYTLSAFIFEPIRWNALLGWRHGLAIEHQANYHFWREVGTRMGIRDIPDTYEKFEQFNREYERQHFQYADSNRELADAAIGSTLRKLPRVLHPVARRVIYALLDDVLLKAFGYPRQPAWFQWSICKLLRLRAFVIRQLPPRRTPYLYTKLRNPSYPHGYRIEELGS